MDEEVKTEEVNQEPQPVYKDTKKTYLLIIVLILIASGLLAIALLPKPNLQTGVVQKQTPKPAQTTLTISSSPVVDSKTTKYMTAITIDTGTNKVTAVQLELSYNPNDITNVDIVPGSFFSNPNILLKKIDPANGRITYALGIPLGQKGVSGKGVLASLQFSAFPSTQSAMITINFEPKTSVSAEGYAQSVIKSLTSSLFTLRPIPFATPQTSSASAK